MRNELHIFIPTMGRVDSQPTWDALPATWEKRTYLVCPPSEVPLHRGRGRNVIPCNLRGIGATRQFIVDRMNTACNKKLLMLDDDLRFYYRGPPRGDRRIDFGLWKCEASHMDEMLCAVESHLDKFAHGGLIPRQCAHSFTHPGESCIRLLRALAYRTDVLERHKIRFTELAVMEDFYVGLSLLMLGYPSFALTDWANDQAANSNAPGGCSSYRTPDIQAQAARKLSSIFPTVVSVEERAVKCGWKGFKGTKVDCKIQWKEAYKQGVIFNGHRKP